MGSKMFLLLFLGLFILTDHSQGVPETPEQTLDVGTVTASVVGEPQAAANSFNTPMPCNSKGQDMMNTPCLRQQPSRRKRKHRGLKKLCQRKKRNLKKCRGFFQPQKGSNTRKFRPSVPI